MPGGYPAAVDQVLLIHTNARRLKRRGHRFRYVSDTSRRTPARGRMTIVVPRVLRSAQPARAKSSPRFVSPHHENW
jgi:hypothetical protein